MIELLGNTGDFLGGVGVIISLVYLAIQIRQNTNSARASSYQSATSSLSEWSSFLGRSPEATRIFLLGMQGSQELNATESAQFSLLATSILRHYENLHYQFLVGNMDEDAWTGWRTRILGSFGEAPGALKFWQVQKPAFSIKFQKFVDDGLGSESRIDAKSVSIFDN